MKGLTNVCCCCSCPLAANSVQLLCGCLISMCRDCCMNQFAHKPTTYRSHITCPICGDRSTSAYIGMIEGTKEAEQREKDLIKSACKHFGEGPPFSYQKNVVKRLLPKLLVLVERFAELGYPKPAECDEPVSNKVVNPILLHVARCEAWRLDAASVAGSDKCPNPSGKLPLGPLELISVRPNHTLEKVLDIIQGRDEVNHIQQACCNCHEQLIAGTTVLTLCSCYTFGCQLCQRRIMKNYKNTYRESPVKCLMCNSRSVPIENIPAAKNLEWALLKQHPRYRSGNVRTEELYCIYADIAQACRMERAIDFHDFIDPASAERGIGSNNLHTKPMCLLEMARMEAERQRRDYFCVPVEQASDVSELPLGPLNRIRIRRDLALETFLTFLNGPADGQPPAARSDSGDAQVLDDPESLFDEVTNTVREQDAPGGDLSPEVCKTIATEMLFEERRASALEEARALSRGAAGTEVARPTRNLRLLLRNYYTPCPYQGCTVNPSCPVYLEQHIRTHHLEPVPEPVAPITAAYTRASHRGRARSGEEASATQLAASLSAGVGSAEGGGEGEGEGEEDFDEEDLSRAMAASLATYRTEVEATTVAARRTPSQVPLMRLDGPGAHSESDVEVGEEGGHRQRAGSKARRSTPRATAPLHTLPQHSLLQGLATAEDDKDTDIGQTVAKPSRQRRRITVEEEEEEEDLGGGSTVQVAERSLSAAARHLSEREQWEDVGELWEPSLVPPATVDASETAARPTAHRALKVKREPHDSAAAAAPVRKSAQHQEQRPAASQPSAVSLPAVTAAPGAQRIKKRKAAFQEADSSEDEAARPAAAVGKPAQRSAGPRRREQQPSPSIAPATEQGAKGLPSLQSTAGFFNEFITRSPAAAAPSDRPAVTAPSAPSVSPSFLETEGGSHAADDVVKTVPPVEVQMHALRRRREIMIQANSAHEQAERLGVLRDRQRKPVGARAVRFAPHVDQYMFVQVDSENENEPELLLGEDASSGSSSAEEKGRPGAYSQREADISPPVIKMERPPPPPGPAPSGPPRPRAVDFFTIVDRHHIIAPELEPGVGSDTFPPAATIMGPGGERPPPPTHPPPPPPRPPVPALTPERQAVLERLTSLYPAESPMPASTSESSSESEDDGAPPPQLPYLQFRQPLAAAGSSAETKVKAGADAAAPATRRIDNSTSQYAYPRAATEASESREEYLRQSVVRYSQEAYRSEEADRARARSARQYPRYGMPYMEDTRRFSEEVVRNPDEVWRSGEAYLNLPNATTRRYEMLFEEGKALDDRLPCPLTTRVEYWLKYPEGALKDQPDAQPCSERGFQRVKIHIETTRSELVAVLKLILLPKYGFRGKVAEWLSSSGGYLQCKGTFYKYNILPGSTITLRDLNRTSPNRYALQARGAGGLSAKDVDDDDAPRYYGWKRKNPHRLSNAQFAMRSVELKMRRQLEQQQAEAEAVEAQEKRRRLSEQSPQDSGGDAAAGPTMRMEVEDRAEVEAELDRWLEHGQEPTCMSLDRQGGPSSASVQVRCRAASPEEGMTSTDSEDGEGKSGASSDVSTGATAGAEAGTEAGAEGVRGQMAQPATSLSEALKAGSQFYPCQASAEAKAIDGADGCPVQSLILPFTGSDVAIAEKVAACASAAVSPPAAAYPLFQLPEQGPGSGAMDVTESDSDGAAAVDLPAVILLPDAPDTSRDTSTALPMLDFVLVQPSEAIEASSSAEGATCMSVTDVSERRFNEEQAGDVTADSSGEDDEEEAADTACGSLVSGTVRSRQQPADSAGVGVCNAAAATEVSQVPRQSQGNARVLSAGEEDEEDGEEAWSLAAVAARLRRPAPEGSDLPTAGDLAGPSALPSGSAYPALASAGPPTAADLPLINQAGSRFADAETVSGSPLAEEVLATEPDPDLRTYPRLSQHTPSPPAVAPSKPPAVPPASQASAPAAGQRLKPSRPRFGSSDEVGNPMEAQLPADPDLEPYKRQKLTSESLRTLQSTLDPGTLRGRFPPRRTFSPPRSKYGPAPELYTRRPVNPQVEALGGYSGLTGVQPPAQMGAAGYSQSSNASATDANKAKSRFGSAEINFEYNELDDETSSDDGEPNPTRKRKGGLRKPKLPQALQTTGSTNAEGISRKRPPIYFDTSVRFAVAPPPSGDSIAPVDLQVLLQGNSDEDELGRRRQQPRRDVGSGRGNGRDSGDSRMGSDRGRDDREGRRGDGGSRDGERERGRGSRGDWQRDSRSYNREDDRYGDRDSARDKERRSRDSRERGNGGSRRGDRDGYNSRERHRRRSPSPSPPPRSRQRMEEAPVGWGLDRSGAAATTPATTSPATSNPTPPPAAAPRLVTRTRQYKDNWGAIHLVEEVVEEPPPPRHRSAASAAAASSYPAPAPTAAVPVAPGLTAQFPFDMTAETPEEADLRRRMMERLAAMEAARANMDQRGGAPANPNLIGRR